MDEPVTNDHTAPLPAARPVASATGAVAPVVQRDPLDTPLPRREALIDLVLVFAVMLTMSLQGLISPFDLSPAQQLAAREMVPVHVAVMGLLILLLIRLLLARSRYSPATIGMTSRGLERAAVDLALAIGCILAIFALLFLGSLIIMALRPDWLEKLERSREGIEAALPPMGIGQIAAMSAVVAVYEEVLFRGFLLTRLRALIGSWKWAVIAASLIFALLHAYEGLFAMTLITGLALLLSLLFIWRRTLTAPVVVHFLFNSIQLALLNATREVPPT